MTDYTGDKLEAHLQEETTNSVKWKVQEYITKKWYLLSPFVFYTCLQKWHS